jgi:hypothetical protein
MLHHKISTAYVSADWAVMERAHAKASQILKRDPKTDTHADQLAGSWVYLITVCDDEVIARIAAGQEAGTTTTPEERIRSSPNSKVRRF